MALVIGGIIGLQRELNRNSAGFRTHILVSLGACIAMITNEFLFYEFPDAQIDVARMGSYVISGIGFLGAGSILKDGFRVRGLTTAAGLWVVACLGIAIGAGFYKAAIFGGVMVVLVLTLLKFIESKFMNRRERTQIDLQIKNTPGQLAKTLSIIGSTGVLIKDVDLQGSDKKWVDVTIYSTVPKGIAIEKLHDLLEEAKGIIVLSIELL